MKHVKNFLFSLLDGIMFIMGFDCKARREGVEVSIIDLSGQGRDKYGK